jgi:hypothetical protein
MKDSQGAIGMRVWRMRTGISIRVKPSDRKRLNAILNDRNAPHKHVWRAEIILLTDEGLGTNAIMRRTRKSKTCVWRWQERFMEEGVDGRCTTRRVPRGLRRLARRWPSGSLP